MGIAKASLFKGLRAHHIGLRRVEWQLTIQGLVDIKIGALAQSICQSVDPTGLEARVDQRCKRQVRLLRILSALPSPSACGNFGASRLIRRCLVGL